MRLLKDLICLFGGIGMCSEESAQSLDRPTTRPGRPDYWLRFSRILSRILRHDESFSPRSWMWKEQSKYSRESRPRRFSWNLSKTRVIPRHWRSRYWTESCRMDC